MGDSAVTFLNREDESRFITKLLPPSELSSSLLIIRSPSGYGKSTLVDHVLSTLESPTQVVSLVDPQIRGKQGLRGIFDGFYIQRCAEDLTRRSGRDYPSLRSFMHDRRWAIVREKRIRDVARQFPGVRTLHKLAVDYFDRLTGTGSYEEGVILRSDSASAIGLCRDYVDMLMRRGSGIYVLREAQHIDSESLRFFLAQNLASPQNHLIVEYTADDDSFAPEHEKIILQNIETHPNAHILQLLRLEKAHLEQLVRRYAGGRIELSSDYYATWKGNLRSVMEIKYRAAIGRKIKTAQDLQLEIGGLSRQLRDHFGELADLEQMVVAILIANIEGMHRETLGRVAGLLPEAPSRAKLELSLKQLIHVHEFVEWGPDGLRVQNEDIVTALEQLPRFKGLVAIAQTMLRDHYRDHLEGDSASAEPLSVAVRQAFRLTLATGDIHGLLTLAAELTDRIRTANDQCVYIDIVHTALMSEQDLLTTEKEYLIDWAASLAYDIGSFRQAADLLALLPRKSTFHQAMLACCAQEIGDHQLALALVRNKPEEWPGPDARVAASLIDIITSRALNDTAHAADKLNAVLDDPEAQNSPLYGYALRFTEAVSDIPDCTPKVMEGARLLGIANLSKSRAYSLLSGAIHLAREGRTLEASALLENARTTLKGEIRNEYILLNNEAVIGLLSSDPDFDRCCDLLLRAVGLVREDYSELTILNNLAIATWEAGHRDEAMRYARRAVAALEAPSFGDRNIFWAVCFNAARLHRLSGEESKAAQVMTIAAATGKLPSSYLDYWSFRLGRTIELADKYRHMASFAYHPLYLSNWLVDLEGLTVLKKSPPG